jgi:hypothetical protein
MKGFRIKESQFVLAGEIKSWYIFLLPEDKGKSEDKD